MNSDEKVVVIHQYTNYLNYKYRHLSDSEFIDCPGAACFSRLTYERDKKYNPSIGVEVSIDCFTIPKKNGFCALTEEEMLAWLAEIKQWIEYEYTLTKDDEKFVVQFITHIPMGALKILLTLIRFAFEAPFNLALKEAFVITEKGYFPDNLILHKYQVIQNTNTSYTVNTNHCFCNIQRIPLLSIEQLKEKVKNYTDLDKYSKSLKLENTLRLGICRGNQLLTVLNGGKLVQDVTNHAGRAHPVLATNGMTYSTSSCHHQMAYPYNMPKEKYEILAHSVPKLSQHYEGGGIHWQDHFEEVEVIYFPETNSLGVQGHPEMMDENSPFVNYINELIISKLNK